MNQLAVILATFGYVGYFPIAPGTAGSAVGLIFVWAMSTLSLAGQIAAILVVTVLAMVAADIVAKSVGLKDPGIIVADEIAGMMVTMVALPFTLTSVVLGFVLFRVMDVVKPPPARQFENFKGGVGVVADDLMAGIYAHLVLRGLLMVAG